MLSQEFPPCMMEQFGTAGNFCSLEKKKINKKEYEILMSNVFFKPILDEAVYNECNFSGMLLLNKKNAS